MEPLSLIGVGSSLLGGIFGGNAAKKAAKSQEQLAREQLALQKEQYNQTRQDLSPYAGTGNIANAAYAYELGLGPRPMIGGQPLAIETIPGTSTPGAMGKPGSVMPSADQRRMYGSEAYMYAAADNMRRGGGTTPTQYRVGGQTFGTLAEAQAYANANPQGGTEYQGFQKTPGYDFMVNQATDAVQSSAAARGMLGSGNTMEALASTIGGYANQTYDNYLNRLSGVSSNGQNAAGMQAANNANYANTGSNSLANIGNARSTGYIGQANAINGGLENALAAWQYGRATRPA